MKIPEQRYRSPLARHLRSHNGVAALAEGVGNRGNQSQQEFAKFWQTS